MKKVRFHLHLLAKPKDINVGFYQAHKKTLLWTEMFLLMLCRKKNPEILNIAGHVFLEDGSIEGVTSPCKGMGKNVKTFRNALGIDNGHKKLIASVSPQLATDRPPSPISTAQPTAILLSSTKTT
jgi:hypothetical protein